MDEKEKTNTLGSETTDPTLVKTSNTVSPSEVPEADVAIETPKAVDFPTESSLSNPTDTTAPEINSSGFIPPTPDIDSYHKDDVSSSVSNMPPVEGYSFSSPEESKKKFSFALTPKVKKILIIVPSAIAALALLGVGGYFGYQFYIKSSNSRILNAAAKNIVNGKSFQANYQISASGLSLEGKLFMDKDQNIKIAIDNDIFPIEAMYIKAEDKAYLKDASGTFSSEYFEEYDEDTPAKNEYMEFDNLKKWLEKQKEIKPIVDQLSPNNNYFTAANIKLIKRLEDEKIDRKNLFKFNLTPDDKANAETTKKLNETLGRAEFLDSGKIKSTSSSIDFWINKKDMKLYRIKGETKLSSSYELPNYEKCIDSNDEGAFVKCMETSKKEIKQDLTYKWTIEFNYDYKDKIELPKDAKIGEKTDLVMEEKSESVKARDTKKKADLHEIQNALETYFTDTAEYPATNSVDIKLVPNYLKNSLSEMSGKSGNKTYTYTATGSPASAYTLRVELENQNDTGPDVVTISGKKYFQVTSKQ
jgi:Tfp pilus assembly protein PilE